MLGFISGPEGSAFMDFFSVLCYPDHFIFFHEASAGCPDVPDLLWYISLYESFIIIHTVLFILNQLVKIQYFLLCKHFKMQEPSILGMNVFILTFPDSNIGPF